MVNWQYTVISYWIEYWIYDMKHEIMFDYIFRDTEILFFEILFIQDGLHE